MNRFIIIGLVIFGIAASAPQVGPQLFALFIHDTGSLAGAADASAAAPAETAAPAAAPAVVEEAALAVEHSDPGLPRGRTSIRAAPDGHYYAGAVINGRQASVVVDTGATVVALTAETAKSLGIVLGRAAYTARVETANGTVRAAPVRLREVRIGGVRVLGVNALVLPEKALSTNLLGMSFLNRLQKFEAGGGNLVLVQ